MEDGRPARPRFRSSKTKLFSFNIGRAGRPSSIIVYRLRLAVDHSLWLNLPVRVAIDIRRMTEFGVGTYTRNIVRALGRLDRESKYFLIGPPEKVAEIGPLPPNFHTVPLLGNDATHQELFRLSRHPQAPALRPGAYSAPVLAAAKSALSLRDDRA